MANKLIQMKDGNDNIYPITYSKVLYDNSTGEEDITLYDYAYYYSYFEIYYKDYDGQVGYTKVYHPDGATFWAFGGATSPSSYWYFKYSLYHVNNDTIYHINHGEKELVNGTTSFNSYGNVFKITRVIGYK